MKKIMVFAMVAVAVGSTFAMLRPQDQKQTKVLQQPDKSAYPIADYDAEEPSDLNLRKLRNARAKRHNLRLKPTDKVDVRGMAIAESSNSRWGGPSSHALVEPALPTAQSDLVIVGEVTDARAYLSEDKVNVYSEFTVRINEILKNSTSVRLTPGNSIATIRTGGAVRFRSGKIIERGFHGKPFPQTNRTYVFFLGYESEEQDYPIITAYELRAGSVLPLDGLDVDGSVLEPYAGYQEYKGWEEAAFLNRVRDSINQLTFPISLHSGP